MDTRHQARLLPLLTTITLGLASVGLGACSSEDGSTALSTDLQTTTSTSTASTTTAVPLERTQVVSYQSATVYAGSTDFYFEDSEGQPVQFRVSNLPENQTIDLPTNMLDEAVVEGPPGANPDLVGEAFLLVYDEDDQLIRVELNS